MVIFKRYRIYIIFAAASAFAGVAAYLLIPAFLARLIDYGVVAGDGGVVGAMSVALLLVALFGAGFSVAARYLWAKTKGEIAADLRKTAYDRAVFRPYRNDFDQYLEFAERVERLLAFKAASVSPVAAALIYTATAVIIFIGGFSTAWGNTIGIGISIMWAAYIIFLIKAVNTAVRVIPPFLNEYRKLSESAETLSFHFEPPDGDNDKAALLRRGDISFEGVGFTRPQSEHPVLNGISLTIKAGEHFAVIGEEGAGKTALVSLIYRLFDPSEGVVAVNGIPVGDYKIGELREKIGLVAPKRGGIFKGTVYENIAISRPDASEIEVSKAAEAAMTGLALSYTVEEDGANLTEEQRDRLLIARALLKNPEIIILDDCNLAPDGHHGITIIKTSRTALGITAADRVAVMENGVITAIGTHSELMINSELYRRLTRGEG
ncbi:MAG: ATP-binding cassette domain-containing protein [Oscillospiraceae bacterium]|nr:ATP-binding cassette domain-containing protein [Oscillospiraceae bacterium]